jgi:catabolite regulation protein CreA
MPSVSHANREVGNFATSGFIFKDTLHIQAIEDPQIPGITLYVSDYQRPITEKLSKDFFNDPSSSSLACAQTAPVVLSKDINLSSDGSEVFEESKSLFFKVNCT